jgi:hypothetical protein
VIAAGLISLHSIDESFIERVRKVAVDSLQVPLRVIEDFSLGFPAVISSI